MKNYFYIILVILLLLPFYPISLLRAAGSSCTGDTCTLDNPLGSGVTEVSDIVGIALKGLLGIVGALALFFFIQGGFAWMTSAGNAERIKKGKDTMMWASMGLLVVFASYSFLSFILQMIGA